jgi:hypothetical protein
VVFNWIDESGGCNACRAEDTESQEGLGGSFRSGRVVKLQHSGM